MKAEDLSPEQEVETVRTALVRLAADLPPVANIVEAFKELFVV